MAAFVSSLSRGPPALEATGMTAIEHGVQVWAKKSRVEIATLLFFDAVNRKSVKRFFFSL